MKFNVNKEVKVKLTPFGEKVLRLEEVNYKIDGDGYSTFHMWQVMSYFGEYLYNGCVMPFEADVILVV